MSPLPPYNVRSKCPKCGAASEISTQYQTGVHHTGCSVPDELIRHGGLDTNCLNFEHHERRCRRCGFEWAEAVLP